MPVTLHFESTGTVPGDGRPVSMVGKTLTVGRGTENDMVLPDPDKLISKRHCTLEQTDAEVIVVDLSSNGTFLNYGKVPLGPTPTPLNNGDILTMGNFEIRVEISATQDTASGPSSVAASTMGSAAGLGSVLDDLTSGNGPGADVDFIDDLLGTNSSPEGPQSVKRPQPGDDGLLPPLDIDDDLFQPADTGAAQDTPMGASRADHTASVHDSFSPAIPSSQPIPDDWDIDDPFASPELPAERPKEAPVEPPMQRIAVREEDPATPASTDPAPIAAEDLPRSTVERAPTGDGDDAAARAFLKAVGAPQLGSDVQDLVPTFSRLGHVFRILIHGMREILMTRSSIKSEFRIEHTRISAGGNNPLKFSVSPEQAVEAMIEPSVRGYLDATDAANEALQDIKAHEVAMIAGMEAALKGILARLSPEELESRLQPSGGLGGLLSNKKARYWEIYQDMYAEISDEAEKDFHELFSKEFARAYEAQLERLK